MWDYLAGPFLASALLLVAAGAPKVLDPLPLVRAMRSVGVPSHRHLVRGFAAGEVVLGAAALAFPGAVMASLVALSYAGFTGFVVLALTRGGVLASCGCFGKSDTPPTRTHVAVTGLAAVAAIGVALAAPASAWAGDPLELTLLGAATLLLAFLAWQVLAVLPTTSAAAIRSAGRA